MEKQREDFISGTRGKYADVRAHLNERSRRIWAAAEAKSYGRGGITAVHRATGIDQKTIRKGLEEIMNRDRGCPENERIRRQGGGRKKITDISPSVLSEIEDIVDSTTRGDPESPLQWTSKSTYHIAGELAKKGHAICQKSVHTLLTEKLGYSLQSNRKKQEGASHEDRDAQFEHIGSKIKAVREEGCPALSVDTKKKENIGNYKNSGREYAPKGKPVPVNTHDFPDKKLGKAAPYGVYDIGENKGWVSVGISSDTAEFAVNAIRAWWHCLGKGSYESAGKIFITADCGGSNGNRVRLWKIELQKFADEIQKEIHVSHFHPGTSKWNKIEHRMFSYISKNWRGRPLETHEAVVSLIGGTTTKKGLEIRAVLDKNTYRKGIKISDEELARVNSQKADFHGEWNYAILPHM